MQLNRIVGVVVGFWLTPFVLGFVDQSEYGLYVLAIGVASWLGVCDLGLSAGLQVELSRRSLTRDRFLLVRYASSAFCGQLAVAGLIVGLAAGAGGIVPSAVACFMDDFEACIAHLRMPVNHRRAIRTTNLLERLFVEERRRLKIIPNAFGEKAVLKLMFGAMIRAAERWRPIKVTDFQRRQMAAIREELDQEYRAQTGLAKQTSKDDTADKLSSRSRT